MQRPPARDLPSEGLTLPETRAYVAEVGAVFKKLSGLGLTPVLVGGMALVILGSRRVTRDFDFVVARPGDRLEPLLDVFYERGLELASRLNAEGDKGNRDSQQHLKAHP